MAVCCLHRKGSNRLTTVRQVAYLEYALRQERQAVAWTGYRNAMLRHGQAQGRQACAWTGQPAATNGHSPHTGSHYAARPNTGRYMAASPWRFAAHIVKVRTVSRQFAEDRNRDTRLMPGQASEEATKNHTPHINHHCAARPNTGSYMAAKLWRLAAYIVKARAVSRQRAGSRVWITHCDRHRQAVAWTGTGSPGLRLDRPASNNKQTYATH